MSGIHQLPAFRPDPRIGVAEQVERVGAAPSLIPRREQRADVAQTGRADESVEERVRHDVAVGVTGEPTVEIDANTAEHQRDADGEGVRVHAQPDAELRHDPVRREGRRGCRRPAERLPPRDAQRGAAPTGHAG